MAVVLITGCSSGFGRLSALAFARNGDRVYATVRDESAVDELNRLAAEEKLSINPVLLDVTDRQAINVTVEQVIRSEKVIDVLINNAGVAIPAALEDMDVEQLELLMDTNFYGPIWLSRAVLPHMRERKQGRIIMVSSLSALVGLPGEGMYSASKAALEAAAEALRHEVDRFGIKVSLIQPGLFNTRMPVKMAATAKKLNSPYSALINYLLERMNRGKDEGDDPQVVADLLVEIAGMEEPALRYPAGEQAGAIVKMIKELADDDRDRFLQDVNDTAWWSAGEKPPD